MKAQFKTLEASVAAIFLIAFIAWYFAFKPKIPEVESLDLKLIVLRTLSTLDKGEELRNFVYSNNTEEIEKRLYAFIPRKFDYKVLICSNSCSYSIEAKFVYSISYFLATDSKDFRNREVLVYVWEA